MKKIIIRLDLLFHFQSEEYFHLLDYNNLKKKKKNDELDQISNIRISFVKREVPQINGWRTENMPEIMLIIDSNQTILIMFSWHDWSYFGIRTFGLKEEDSNWSWNQHQNGQDEEWQSFQTIISFPFSII